MASGVSTESSEYKIPPTHLELNLFFWGLADVEAHAHP